MTTTNECYAYFSVAGSFEPAQITARVGVEPTRTAQEDDPIPGSRQRKKCNRWELHSRLDRTEEIAAHIRDVLDQLDGNKDAFRRLSLELGGEMEVVGYFNAGYPGMFFTESTVRRLAEYALSIDFDFYFDATSLGAESS